MSIKKYWSRFSASYPKVIVYMLQTSRYDLKEYFKWLRRTTNFRSVIKKSKLDYTKKAMLLLSICWGITIVFCVLSILLCVQSKITNNPFLLIFAAIIFLIYPFVISCGIVIPLWIGQRFIQGPKQRKMINEAKEIISNHTALKIAIVGSYGKTSMKEILQTVLSEGKKVAYTPGNMNTPIGISRFAKKLDGNEEIIIFELGEGKVGDVRELCEITKPDIGIITGINEAHLESFGSIENTIDTIFEIKEYLGDKKLYKNIENKLVASKVTKNDKFIFNNKGTDGWKISNEEITPQGTSFVAKKGDEKIVTQTGLLGTHNLGFISVAIDIADSVGLTTVQIRSGIEKTKPFEHRMEPRNFNGALMIDDTYNGNSEGVKVGVELLKRLDAKRRIYITPGLVEQGDKTQEVHEKIGEQIAKVADVVVLFDNSVTEFIKTGLNKAEFKGDLMIIDDPAKFYANLDQFIAVGDVFMMQNDWTDNYK